MDSSEDNDAVYLTAVEGSIDPQASALRKHFASCRQSVDSFINDLLCRADDIVRQKSFDIAKLQNELYTLRSQLLSVSGSTGAVGELHSLGQPPPIGELSSPTLQETNVQAAMRWGMNAKMYKQVTPIADDALCCGDGMTKTRTDRKGIMNCRASLVSGSNDSDNDTEEERDSNVFKRNKTNSLIGKSQEPRGEGGRAAPKQVFADAQAMKEQIRDAVTKKDYHVADFYRETGWCQYIARSTLFEYGTLVIILFNALWIAHDTDANPSPILVSAPLYFQVAEHMFCSYFTIEILLRFFSFANKKNCLRDRWFCFDSGLVTMMVLETWVLVLTILIFFPDLDTSQMINTAVLKVIKLVRLTRMTRMARLLRAIPELIILIKGIHCALRSVAFTFLLLVIIMYFYAIVIRQMFDWVSVPDGFDISSVTATMRTLFVYAIVPDNAPFITWCMDESHFMGILAYSFVFVASLTVMNMLVGVLCEVVSVVSTVEKEQLTVRFVKEQLLSMFPDQDDDQLITKREFMKLLKKPAASRIIHEIGVDVVGLIDLSEYIFKDEGDQLSFADFMDIILQLRGSNTSTVKDVVDLRNFINKKLKEYNKTLNKHMKKIQKELHAGLESGCNAATTSRAHMYPEHGPTNQSPGRYVGPGMDAKVAAKRAPRKSVS